MTNAQKKTQNKGLYTCTSCGASFRADLPNCPYCGTANPKAAEAAYMLKMKGIHHRLAKVPQETTKAVGEEIHESTHLLKIVAIIVGIIVAAVLLIFGVIHFRELRHEEAEYNWSLEAFPKMDEAYESGDYDLMLDLYTEAINEGHYVSSWRHNEFAYRLMNIYMIEDLLDQEEKGTTLNRNDYEYLFCQEEELAAMDSNKDLTAADKAYLKEQAGLCLEDYEKRFPITEEQQKLIDRDNKEFGLMTPDTSDAYLKQYFETHDIPE